MDITSCLSFMFVADRAPTRRLLCLLTQRPWAYNRMQMRQHCTAVWVEKLVLMRLNRSFCKSVKPINAKRYRHIWYEMVIGIHIILFQFKLYSWTKILDLGAEGKLINWVWNNFWWWNNHTYAVTKYQAYPSIVNLDSSIIFKPVNSNVTNRYFTNY